MEELCPSFNRIKPSISKPENWAYSRPCPGTTYSLLNPSAHNPIKVPSPSSEPLQNKKMPPSGSDVDTQRFNGGSKVGPGESDPIPVEPHLSPGESEASPSEPEKTRSIKRYWVTRCKTEWLELQRQLRRHHLFALLDGAFLVAV